jgi:hypothetical protein
MASSRWRWHSRYEQPSYRATEGVFLWFIFMWFFSMLSAASPLATRRCHALAQSILALVSLLTFPYFYVIYSTLFLFRLSVNCLNMRSATFVLLEFLLHASNNHRSSFRDLHMSDAHDRIISYVDYFIKIVYHARLELTSIWLLCDYFISEYIVNHIFWF